LKLTNRGQLNRLPASYATLEDVCSIFSNDLESVTIPAFPVIAEIKEAMLRQGALAAMMSGSGPTVFGLFRERETAVKAQAALSKGTGWFAAAVETL
jgi:4-diphosphocytidyl-2-C-methyl-D-erythritol kinase